MLPTHGLSHLVIRVTDLARAKRFYGETLGFPIVLEVADIVLVNANGVLLGMRGDNAETPANERFNPFRVGLDHIALAVADPAMLEGLPEKLDAAGVPNNGIEDDALGNGRYISFYDPDGIAWEIYYLPSL